MIALRDSPEPPGPSWTGKYTFCGDHDVVAAGELLERSSDGFL
jgi:hypothetical protein